MEVNKKLKSIYFLWAINYEGPPPRSFASNFEEHLEYERYDFADDWLEKILLECNIVTKEEFEAQLVIIKGMINLYFEQQGKKIERRARKSLNIYYEKCKKEGISPF